MQRVVYCPSADEVPNAEKIAAEYGIPIVIGACPAIDDIAFDKAKTQILLIPTDQFFTVTSVVARMGMPFSATYVDEITPVNGVWLDISNKTTGISWRQDPEINPTHPISAYFKIAFKATGEYRLSVLDNDGLIAYEDVSVVL